MFAEFLLPQELLKLCLLPVWGRGHCEMPIWSNGHLSTATRTPLQGASQECSLSGSQHCSPLGSPHTSSHCPC